MQQTSGPSIAVIPGDGIGPEVTREALKALRAAGASAGIRLRFTEFPWGSDYYLQHGRMMPPDALGTLAKFDAIYLGAIGHPEIQDHVTLDGLLLPIRRSFDQYVCLRPNVLFQGVASPLRDKEPGSIDVTVVRENTEGEYANAGGFVHQGFAEEIGLQTGVFTRRGCERVIGYAFELAGSGTRRRHVTSVTKSNAMGYGMVVWDRAFQEVSSRYPKVATRSMLVDAACMEMVRRPEAFDVVVASNLFGDILSDLAAGITGSIGLAPSGNINPERRFPSMFEPVHGSAPDIAGTGRANPLAAILAGAMMLRHLGNQAAARDLEGRVARVLEAGATLTPDLGGTATTARVGDAVVEAAGAA